MKKILLFFLFILIFFLGYFIKKENYNNSNYISDIVLEIENKEENKNLAIKKLLDLKNILSFGDIHKEKIKIIYEKIEEIYLKKEKNFRIAHAGGSFNGYNYTNSLDSLEYNKYFFELFEIDFSWTKDNKLVCIHDWTGAFLRTFNVSEIGPVSYEKFIELVEKNKKFKNCTLETLINWLFKNENKFIVTDIKEKNIEGLSYISKEYPKFRKNFIVQIYEPSDYDIVKNLGFDKIILTLYSYGGNLEKLLSEIKGKDYFAITINKEKISDGWLKPIKNLGFKIYTHTINDEYDFLKYKNLGVDEIYTDNFLQ